MQKRTLQEKDVAGEFHRQAAEARALAATFSDRQTISDLQNFAAALEQDTTEHHVSDRAAAAWKARKAS